MKILIVSSYFPPQNAVASLRPYSWAKYWSRAGHDVTVLTTVKRNEKNNTNFDCSGFTLIETPLNMPFRTVNAVVKQSDTNSDGYLQKKVSLKIKILSSIKKIYIKFIEKTGCFATIRFPDWHDGWIKEAVKHLPCMDYDLLVTTAGPYSVHRAGLYLRKKGWKGKWICDWRDLCSGNYMYKGFFLFWPYERFLENKFHKKADFVTTVSEGLSEIIQRKTNTPVYTIFNGFDSEDFAFLFENERKQSDKYLISYLGTVYKGYRDPEPLLMALGQLDKEGVITSDDVEVRFAGNHTADVTDLAKKCGADKYFKYIGFIPRTQSLQLQYDSDAVIFMEYDNSKVRGNLSAKIFEYLYIAKKILAIGLSNTTTPGHLIELCNAGICLGSDVEAIKRYLLKEIVAKKKGSKSVELQKNMEEINKYSRKVQAEKMLELLKDNY